MAEMRRHGIKLALGYTVEGFEEKKGGVDVLLKDEPSLHADMVVLAGPANKQGRIAALLRQRSGKSGGLYD